MVVIKRKKKKVRKLPIAKRGGGLGAIMAGLTSAIGASASVVKAIRGIQNASKLRRERERHNRQMEAIALRGIKKKKGAGIRQKKGKRRRRHKNFF